MQLDCFQRTCSGVCLLLRDDYALLGWSCLTFESSGILWKPGKSLEIPWNPCCVWHCTIAKVLCRTANQVITTTVDTVVNTWCKRQCPIGALSSLGKHFKSVAEKFMMTSSDDVKMDECCCRAGPWLFSDGRGPAMVSHGRDSLWAHWQPPACLVRLHPVIAPMRRLCVSGACC